jgi:hypothetical protein
MRAKLCWVRLPRYWCRNASGVTIRQGLHRLNGPLDNFLDSAISERNSGYASRPSGDGGGKDCINSKNSAADRLKSNDECSLRIEYSRLISEYSKL